MARIPRTPGEAPAREFEPAPLPVSPRRRRDPRKVPHSPPAQGGVGRDPPTGPERDPELQGH